MLSHVADSETAGYISYVLQPYWNVCLYFENISDPFIRHNKIKQ